MTAVPTATAMTTTAVDLTAGAVSHETEDWHTIEWTRAHRIVRRLQARIVQATQAGRWNKVKALQHLLTHSYSGKVVAVRRVTENHGKNTPGVDRVLWFTPWTCSHDWLRFWEDESPQPRKGGCRISSQK